MNDSIKARLLADPTISGSVNSVTAKMAGYEFDYTARHGTPAFDPALEFRARHTFADHIVPELHGIATSALQRLSDVPPIATDLSPEAVCEAVAELTAARDEVLQLGRDAVYEHSHPAPRFPGPIPRCYGPARPMIVKLFGLGLEEEF